ncbi:tetratricopeptide repeat protein [Streptomyces triticirhizae]|nr:tetratricopeptide repeat protein [Streptomyces triticirhizae]
MARRDPADGRPEESDAQETPLGLQSTRPASPRWHRWRDLHNEGTRLAQAGRVRRARARLRAAEAETRVPDVDAEGLFHRARSLGNLATLAENAGDLAESERLLGEAIALCRRLVGSPAGDPTEQGPRPPAGTGPAGGAGTAPAGGGEPAGGGDPTGGRPRAETGPTGTSAKDRNPTEQGPRPPASDRPPAKAEHPTGGGHLGTTGPTGGDPAETGPTAGGDPTAGAARDVGGRPQAGNEARAGAAPPAGAGAPAGGGAAASRVAGPWAGDALWTLVSALASRAQTRMLAQRPDLVKADLDEAFALAETEPEPPELVTFTLHGARAGQLMMTGELAEAEQEALIALDVALAFRPELAAFPCESLARIALACDNPEGVEEFRRIAAEPHAFNEELTAEAPGLELATPVAEPGPITHSTPGRPAAMPWASHPRWRRCAALNAEGVRLASAGQLDEAERALRAAERATHAVGGGRDALVCRASALLNLVGVAEAGGDIPTALELATEAVGLFATVVAAAEADAGPDGPAAVAMAAQLLGARNLRAALLRESGQHDAALAELARVEAALPALGAGSEDAWVWLLLVRATVFAAQGRLAEADETGRAALALAQEHVPVLAPRVHVLLADLAGTLGDEAASRERFALAGELFAVLDDARGEAATLISLGRNAYLAGRAEEADACYARAEALLAREGHAAQLAACRLGRAAVAAVGGRAAEGLALLDAARAELGAGATPLQRIAFHQVRAGALDALGRFDEADAEVLAARTLAEESLGWHVALTLDWWRADSHARWAAALPAEERGPVLARALEVAVPAALAADAARQFFAAGGERERWVALAAAPALRAAMVAVRNAGDEALAVALIDHLTATATLSVAPSAGGARPALPDMAALPDVAVLPVPPREPPTGDELSYAAAALGLATGGDPAFPAPRLALPPRVRVARGVASPLEPWIERAERVYGFAVRAAEAVRAW